MVDVTDKCNKNLYIESNEGSYSSVEEVVANDLTIFQKRALLELKKLVQDAIENKRLTSIESSHHHAIVWGGPKVGDKRSDDSIKSKFPSNAYGMIMNTLLWREQVSIESPLPEDLGNNNNKNVMFKHGYDNEGYPVWCLVEPEEVSIWGIPLLADERTDVILLKFLRARDFSATDAFNMIRNTIRWRKEFGVDALIEEDLGSDYDKVVFTHGVDKHGQPVCYNVFGEFQNKELYRTTFSSAETKNKFLRWLIQFLEKTIRNLDFSPKGINSFVIVNDLEKSPGYGNKDLYIVIDQFLGILHDNYPEFAAKQLCINVSWWYWAYNWIYLTVFTPRSKNKFVFASASKTAETLFKHIAPEQVPVQFGGHSKLTEHEFSAADPVTEVTIKPGNKHPIEFASAEESELVWELRVIGCDVSYSAEFKPAKEGGDTVNIRKLKKLSPTDEPVISDSFEVTEPGKVVITVDNQSSKKKKLLYRSKFKVSQ